MKRVSFDSVSSESCNTKRGKVSLATYHKWRMELDRECKTLSWLECRNQENCRKAFKCKVCIQYHLSIESRRNFSNKWIVGADSVRISNIKDHAHSDQHTHAMRLLRKSQAQASGLDASTYAPIAKALNQISELTEKSSGLSLILLILLLSDSYPLLTTLLCVTWNLSMVLVLVPPTVMKMPARHFATSLRSLGGSI